MHSPRIDRLFVYGTLTVPEIAEAVLGRVPDSAEAHVLGYRCYLVRGQVYPGALPDPEHRMQGRLYSGLTDADWRALDDYEGALYHMVSLPVVVGQHQVAAGCYVVRPKRRSEVSSTEWDLSRFVAEHLEGFRRGWE